jgi:hypothetical protein
MWKIESVTTTGNYKYARVPEHPSATKNGYVLLHRIVMENHLGRLLEPDEDVHHIDEDPYNNSVGNLEVVPHKEHASQHAKSRGRLMVDLCCPWCGEIFSRTKSQSFLNKGSEFTCCSPSCRGKLSKEVQLNGRTSRVEDAISNNLIRVYKKYPEPK